MLIESKSIFAFEALIISIPLTLYTRFGTEFLTLVRYVVVVVADYVYVTTVWKKR